MPDCVVHRSCSNSSGRMSIGPRLWTSPDLVDTLDLPTFDGHPRRGALREVMLEITTRKNLATHLSQVEARVSFQGIWKMFPNSKTSHPCARTLVSPMWSVWTQRAQRNSAARCAVREMTVQMGTVRRGHRSDWGYICAVPEHMKHSRDPKIHLKGTVL